MTPLQTAVNREDGIAVGNAEQSSRYRPPKWSGHYLLTLRNLRNFCPFLDTP